jgi:hypothetical protein
MEIGTGVSMAGRRALVCTKSVGMNAMLDPLMVLNLTPVHGGVDRCQVAAGSPWNPEVWASGTHSVHSCFA